MPDLTAGNGGIAPTEIDWLRILPFIGMHLACLLPLWIGWSPTALAVCFALLYVRVFFVTAFYHRYFSHRSYRTSRIMQFLFALLGSSAVQRGPLWWAAHHRNHHCYADTARDPHSPRTDGFLHSHIGWFLTRRAFRRPLHSVPDLAKFPELRFVDRFDLLVPIMLACALFWSGEYLSNHYPGLQTDGIHLLTWGFFISTVLLYHVTFFVNSLAHRFGQRNYATADDSRNSLWLALLTFGEGWHNNHHRYPAAVRQGFLWWQIDITYLLLRVLAKVRLIWDLRGVPPRVLDERRDTTRS